MTQIKLRTRVYEKRKGTSTEVTADSPLSNDAKLTIKVAVDGRINQEKQSYFENFITRSLVKIVSDNSLKEVV